MWLLRVWLVAAIAAATLLCSVAADTHDVVCLSRDCRVALLHPSSDQVAAARSMDGVFVYTTADAHDDPALLHYGTAWQGNAGAVVSGACTAERASRGRCGARSVAVPLLPSVPSFLSSLPLEALGDVWVSSVDVVLGSASEDAPPQRARAVVSLWAATPGDAKGRPHGPVGNDVVTWRPPVRTLMTGCARRCCKNRRSVFPSSRLTDAADAHSQLVPTRPARARAGVHVAARTTGRLSRHVRRASRLGPVVR